MKRRWYHFHLVTFLVTLSVAVGFAKITATGPFAYNRHIMQWPLAPGGDAQILHTNYFDIGSALLLTAGTATFFELWLRQRQVFKIRLQTIFVLIAAAAVLLGFAKWDIRILAEYPHDAIRWHGTWYVP